MTQSLNNDRVKKIEILAVLLTGIGKFIFFNGLHMQFWFILLASIFWTSYILWRIQSDRSVLVLWGFRKDGFRDSMTMIAPLALIALVLFVLYGLKSGNLILSWHIVPSLILYPFWGTIQQFLIMALLAGNLSSMQKFRLSKFAVVGVTATFFSIVHFPYYLLIAGTFLLAIVYTLVYLKYRNLWLLGLLHGWLGSFFYFFVLGKDAWMTFVESIW
jgi:hypothetical protein